MAGEISSLGIGSSGVLSADTISKLKDNDKTLTVKPIENKIELNEKKIKSLDLLSSLSTTLEGSASSLKDDSLYEKRTVSGNNSGVEVTVKDGVGIQDFSISDVALAKKSVVQSGTFSSSDDKIASDSGTYNLHIDGTDYKIDYDSDMTYDDLKTKINDIAGDDVTASILQLSDDKYSLIITSDKTGKDQQIGLVDLDGNIDDSLKDDILKSDAFNDKSDSIATGDGSLTIKVGDDSFDFDYTDSTSLQDLADMINDDTDASADVFASIIKNKDNKYELVLTAKNPGEDKDISIKDNSDDKNLSTKLTDNSTADSGDATDIQTARDATFKYNGIELTRSTNKIDDIKFGITIKLQTEDASANISISQDAQPIKDELEAFVDSFNSMQKQLDAMTLADVDAGKIGLFNGNNSINSIGRDLKTLLTSRDSNTNEGLSQFGISLGRNGKLTFDSSVFDKKMSDDPEGVKNFFSGKTTVNDNDSITRTDGIFKKLYNKINSFTSTNGTITTINNGLSKESSQLEVSKQRALDFLNSRYDSMTARYAAYDSIISQMNNSFSSLKQQIEMAVNGN
ncbi:MAG: flagellar filament capping protein FliD [Campylobacterales bacterium]